MTAPETTGPGPLTRVRRNPSAARYDRAAVRVIFDEAPYCHVGFVADGRPVVLPELHHRVGDDLYFHGSRSNRMLGLMTGPAGACVTATLFDGLVLARSVFNHTVHYRSVVAFGHPRRVTGAAEKRRVLDQLVEHLLPGRGAEARPPTPAELARTAVVVMAIEEASVKIEDGPPPDGPDDLELGVWGGHVPLERRWGSPVPDRRGAMVGPDAPPVPPSVADLTGRDAPAVW